MFLIAGVIVVVSVLLVKWFRDRNEGKNERKNVGSNEGITERKNEVNISKEIVTETIKYGQVPLMVFAVNDNGNFDLTDMAGNLLDSSFGNNPKIYINLLDQAEKDIQKNDETGQMISTVGNTKLYQIGQSSYIVNYTRL